MAAAASGAQSARGRQLLEGLQTDARALCTEGHRKSQAVKLVRQGVGVDTHVFCMCVCECVCVSVCVRLCVSGAGD